MRVQWQAHYNMGIEELDDDHKQLFKIAGKIIDTVEAADNMNDRTRFFLVREGVKYLKNYFAEHAIREEAYMRQIGYGDYLAHKRLHDEFQTVQLARFEKIIDRGDCTKEEVLDFVGIGIGWLLEHITTADMAIVGKGVLCRPKAQEYNMEVVEREINMLFVATLNLEVNAKICNSNYGGEFFGDAVYQKCIYRRGAEEIVVLTGIEKKFLVSVAKMVYGEDMAEEDALILSTLEIFGAAFWRTLGERLVNQKEKLEYRECHFLSRREVQKMFEEKLPVVALLFDSEQGKFFVSSDDRTWSRPQKLA